METQDFKTEKINDIDIKYVGKTIEIDNRYLLFTSGNIFDNTEGTYLNIPEYVKEITKKLR